MSKLIAAFILLILLHSTALAHDRRHGNRQGYFYRPFGYQVIRPVGYYQHPRYPHSKCQNDYRRNDYNRDGYYYNYNQYPNYNNYQPDCRLGKRYDPRCNYY